MDVTTKCPNCGLMLALDTSASDEFECPQCGQRLTVESAARRARPVKRSAAPRRTATSSATPAEYSDDIDWSIPEIPQSYKRRKRRSVGVDPAVAWSIGIVSVCILALVIGGVYLSRRGGTDFTTPSVGREAMFAFTPDDWEVQAFVKVGALTRHRHRNSLLLLNLKPTASAGESIDDLDELMICDGVGRGLVMTTHRDAPSNDELRKRGGVVETYGGFEVFRLGPRAACRASDHAIAMADNDATMRRMIDASRSGPKTSPDLPKEFTAFFRVRTRAVRIRSEIPQWMTPFDFLGASMTLQDDGGASLFLFGEASSEENAKEAIPTLDRVRGSFREQLGSVRRLYRGSIADLEKLSSALANNSVVQEGKRVGVRCMISADLFPLLVQAQLSSFAGSPPATTAATTPPVQRTPSPPPVRPSDNSSLPAFIGGVADQAQQAQDVLAGRFGRQRTLMVVGVGFSQTEAGELSDRLIDLAKKTGPVRNELNYNTIHSGGWVACVFAPIDDLEAFAKVIDFASVAQTSPDQRRIYLTPKK